MDSRVNERGAVALVVPLLVLVALVVGAYFVLSGKFSVPSVKKSSDPTVTLQTTVKNPFDKSAQYVNPFSGYKNPFDSLR